MNNERRTPRSFFEPLHAFFGFTLDPCAPPENNLALPKFFTEADDGLARNWYGERVFCNPPYSRGQLMLWTQKCVQEADTETFIALLVPNDRSTRWWQQVVAPHAWHIHDVPYRIAFENGAGGGKAGAKQPSALALFGGPFVHRRS